MQCKGGWHMYLYPYDFCFVTRMYAKSTKNEVQPWGMWQPNSWCSIPFRTNSYMAIKQLINLKPYKPIGAGTLRAHQFRCKSKATGDRGSCWLPGWWYEGEEAGKLRAQGLCPVDLWNSHAAWLETSLLIVDCQKEIALLEHPVAVCTVPFV